MGRKKLEIKRIEDKSSRQVTFTKRRNGIFKKAKQLSVLCGVDVAVVIFSCRGRLYDFSTSRSVTDILQQYRIHKEADEGEGASAGLSEEEPHSKYSSFMTIGELLQTVERHQDIDELLVPDLENLEKQFQSALIVTRSLKTHLMLASVDSLHKKERMLREENKLLQDQVAALKKNEIQKAQTNSSDPGKYHVGCGNKLVTLDLF